MRRRYVVQLNTMKTQNPVYLGRLALGHAQDEKGRLLPVTVSYARTFKTERAALTAAKEAGYKPDEFETVRMFW